MTLVITQPVSDKDAQENLKKTIYTAVPLTRIEPFVQPNEFKQLSRASRNGSVWVWGTTPNNLKGWERIQSGDVVLFYAFNKFFLSSRVISTLHGRPLSLELWGSRADGETWEYIFFIEEPQSISISRVEFNHTVGYLPNAVTQGFRVLDQYKSDRFLDSYRNEVDEEWYQQIAEWNGDLDLPSSAIRRREQEYLRASLLAGKTTGRCGICGQDFPSNILVAAHIKRRAECTREEKLDIPNIAMLICQLGCDALYELGYVAVIDGKVTTHQASTDPPALIRKLRDINGQHCDEWNQNRAAYFRWHATHIQRPA